MVPLSSPCCSWRIPPPLHNADRGSQTKAPLARAGLSRWLVAAGPVTPPSLGAGYLFEAVTEDLVAEVATSDEDRRIQRDRKRVGEGKRVTASGGIGEQPI